MPKPDVRHEMACGYTGPVIPVAWSRIVGTRHATKWCHERPRPHGLGTEELRFFCRRAWFLERQGAPNLLSWVRALAAGRITRDTSTLFNRRIADDVRRRLFALGLAGIAAAIICWFTR